VASSRAAEALAALGATVASVEDLLIRVGLLVDAVPEITRVRLNPVLVSPEAAWVIDARIHVAPAARRPDDVRRL
jgi:hypothetical protein